MGSSGLLDVVAKEYLFVCVGFLLFIAIPKASFFDLPQKPNQSTKQLSVTMVRIPQNQWSQVEQKILYQFYATEKLLLATQKYMLYFLL